MTISGPTGATIYYTTNGTTPSTSSTEYSSPIAITTATTLKAIAVVNGTSSDVVTAAYTIKSSTTPTTDGEYTLVTDLSSLSAGDVITLVGYNGTSDKYFALGAPNTASTDYYGLSSELTITDNTFAAVDGITDLTLEGSEGAWRFNTGSGYLCAQSSGNALGTETSTTNYGKATITEYSSTNHTVTIEFASGASKYLEYNPSATRFACYSTASNQNSVYIYRKSTGSASVAMPTFNPKGGTYTSVQTVTITGAEGTTLKYTTDGSNPTTSSTAKTTTGNTATLTIGKTTTVKAVAVKDGETSSVASATYTMDITPNAPTFTPATGTTMTEPYTLTISADEGCTIYYVVGSNTYLVTDGKVTGNALVYDKDHKATYQQAATFKAVAVDAYGNISDSTTVTYKYTGEVTVPYYENFSESLGNFTVTSTGNSSTYDAPKWYIRTSDSDADVKKYGEIRHYAYAAGYVPSNDVPGAKTKSKRGTTTMISPIINLAGLTSASMNFGHAGKYFGQTTTSKESDGRTSEASGVHTNAEKYCELLVRTYNSTDNSWSAWTNLTIPTWFDQSTSYTRINSGDIDLTSYIPSGKIQVAFRFTCDDNVRGTWNVIKLAVLGVKPATEEDPYHEETLPATQYNGYYTYVVQNDIDVEETNARNKVNASGSVNQDNLNLALYKVPEFTHDDVALVLLGTGNTINKTDGTKLTTSEKVIPAGTPVIIWYKDADPNSALKLYYKNTADQVAKVDKNLLYPSINGAVKQTNKTWYLILEYQGDEPGFYRLQNDWTVGAAGQRKAYLNYENVSASLSADYTTTASGAKHFVLLGEDNTATAVQGVTVVKPAVCDGRVYSLSGQLVGTDLNSLPRGIYIVNGKKICK